MENKERDIILYQRFNKNKIEELYKEKEKERVLESLYEHREDLNIKDFFILSYLCSSKIILDLDLNPNSLYKEVSRVTDMSRNTYNTRIKTLCDYGIISYTNFIFDVSDLIDYLNVDKDKSGSHRYIRVKIYKERDIAYNLLMYIKCNLGKIMSWSDRAKCLNYAKPFGISTPTFDRKRKEINQEKSVNLAKFDKISPNFEKNELFGLIDSIIYTVIDNLDTDEFKEYLYEKSKEAIYNRFIKI